MASIDADLQAAFDYTFPLYASGAQIARRHHCACRQARCQRYGAHPSARAKGPNGFTHGWRQLPEYRQQHAGAQPGACQP